MIWWKWLVVYVTNLIMKDLTNYGHEQILIKSKSLGAGIDLNIALAISNFIFIYFMFENKTCTFSFTKFCLQYQDWNA